MGTEDQDWTTGRGNTRVMLNTDVSFFLPKSSCPSAPPAPCDSSNVITHHLSLSSCFPQMCLVFDIEDSLERNIPCCSKDNGCDDFEAARKRCPMYSQHDRRMRASEAVHDMLGGEYINANRYTHAHDMTL